MKFHPSMPLAAVLLAGVASAALAQSTPSPTGNAPPSPQPMAPSASTGVNSAQPQSSYAQPQGSYGQPSASYSQPQASYAQPQTSYGQPAGQMQSSNSAMAPTGQTAPGYSPGMSTNAAMQPGEQPQGAGDQQIRQAQSRLQAAGLYNGPQDGMMDPDTRAAIAKFQEQHGLRRTESLDPQTLAALNNNNMTTGSGSSASSMTPTTSSTNPGQSPAPIGAGGNTTGAATGTSTGPAIPK